MWGWGERQLDKRSGRVGVGWGRETTRLEKGAGGWWVGETTRLEGGGCGGWGEETTREGAGGGGEKKVSKGESF